jgi:uncharacterized membrane protein HdeD (DUF308 family)
MGAIDIIAGLIILFNLEKIGLGSLALAVAIALLIKGFMSFL